MAMAQTVQPKEMYAQDTNPNHIYDHSLPGNRTEDKVISSSAEASAQITIVVTLQLSSEMTTGKSGGSATMSFLEKNRLQITEEIAQGEGEHLATLLKMMELKSDHKSLTKLQSHFDELVNLDEPAFLSKVKALV
jgi:hypothetical protein